MHGNTTPAPGRDHIAACPDRLTAFVRHSDLLRERHPSRLPVPTVVIAGAY
ncbi:MAG TPA: hypothetical protein GXX25_14770 [Desulfotomaculum sp.]|uniref:hypothetical protein n=1 Tax=Desulfofundulus thermobenzoicus TaxID=29376 RepID=UPI00128F4D56|nr:hypothetical protein [Desulfofundulus thermobenzoicus]HHW45040.1 hypothetical protein [Desulfotomaculum sp.]